MSARQDEVAAPRTRYQGSKRKLLPALREAFEGLAFGRALDLYAGTGTVTLLLRRLGKAVDANDYLAFNGVCARVMLTTVPGSLRPASARDELAWLLHDAPLRARAKVAEGFGGVFFLDHENEQIDRFCQNLDAVPDPATRDLYVYAVGQALLKKRPYNLFHRRNLAMRTRRVRRSFGNAATWERPILDHAVAALSELAELDWPAAPGQGAVHRVDTRGLGALPDGHDLIYLDPPYLNGKGVGVDYADFYHFLEGLCDYRRFDDADPRYTHRPIVRARGAWSTPQSAMDELHRVVARWPAATLVLSYRDDGLPPADAVSRALSADGRRVRVQTPQAYKYALSHARQTRELILVSEAA